MRGWLDKLKSTAKTYSRLYFLVILNTKDNRQKLFFNYPWAYKYSYGTGLVNRKYYFLKYKIVLKTFIEYI